MVVHLLLLMVVVRQILSQDSKATTVEDSKIESSDTVTKIRHSNDTNDIFVVSGSNGELLKVVDEIGQQLLQVNDGLVIHSLKYLQVVLFVVQNLEYVNQDFVLTYNSASHMLYHHPMLHQFNYM